MKSSIATALVSVILISGTTSCKKYEDGPMLSLRSKEERISNIWVIKSATRYGVDVSSRFVDYELELTKPGFANIYYFRDNVLYRGNGIWSLGESNNNLWLHFDNPNLARYYKITKLKEKEMDLSEIGYDNIKLSLKQK